MNTLAIVVLVFLFIGFILAWSPKFTTKNNWRHFFPDMRFSADEFYTRIADEIKKTELKKIDIGRESFLEEHIFSAHRLYLRLTIKEYIFYVCAAPFGSGTFVSWWFCETDESKINNIPIISKMLGLNRQKKTFYQVDVENMYMSAIHEIITSVTEEYSKANGSRSLTPFELQYK